MVEELQKLVAAILGVPEVSPSDRLAEDLGAESMDVVNIVASVEERHGITFDDDELAHVRTVGDLYYATQAALNHGTG